MSFENNTAIAHGGAIYTKRNLTVYGAGGFINDLPLAQACIGFTVRFANDAVWILWWCYSCSLPSA